MAHNRLSLHIHMGHMRYVDYRYDDSGRVALRNYHFCQLTLLVSFWQKKKKLDLYLHTMPKLSFSSASPCSITTA